MTKRFEEQFKDRQVAGSGILNRVGKFSYDPVFTHTKGVKATVSLIELQGLYSRIPVAVEVAYPSEQYNQLRAQIDDVVPVSGKLIAHDTVMHKFFVIAD